MPPKRGKLNASANGRRRHCPGSFQLEEKARKGYSRQQINRVDEWSTDGTIAHNKAFRILVDGEDYDEKEDWSVLQYVNFVQSIEGPKIDHGCEETFRHSVMKELSGTADYHCVSKKFIHVVDYKHGANVKVKAEGNDQLLSYIELVCDHYGINHWHYELYGTIIQPNHPDYDGPDTTQFDPKEVDELYDDLEKIQDKDYFQDGPHCQFCPVKLDCPVIGKAIEQANGLKGIPVNYKQLLKLEKWVKKYFEDLRALCLSRAQTEGLDGFKAVRSYGREVWRNEADAFKQLALFDGLTVEQITKLLTPNQIRELVGDDEITKGLTVRPTGGITLADESDKRKPVRKSSGKEDFQHLFKKEKRNGKSNNRRR